MMTSRIQLGLVLLALSSAARAGAAPPELRLQQLSADQIGSRLVVRYAFAQRVMRHGMGHGQLMLHVSARPRQRPSPPTEMQQAVGSPRGSMELRLSEGVGRARVTVWFTRTGTRDEPLALRVGPVRVQRLELAVNWTADRPLQNAVPVTPFSGPPPAAPPGRPDWANQRAIIAACRAAFDGQVNESACLEAAGRSFVNPQGTIKACERAMEGDTNELACLRAATGAGYDMSKAIAACDACMDGDRNELACVKAASGAPQDATATIEACDKSQEGDRAELQCIVRGTRRPGR